MEIVEPKVFYDIRGIVTQTNCEKYEKSQQLRT